MLLPGSRSLPSVPAPGKAKPFTIITGFRGPQPFKNFFLMYVCERVSACVSTGKPRVSRHREPLEAGTELGSS